jgi:hypothetical protein
MGVLRAAKAGIPRPNRLARGAFTGSPTAGEVSRRPSELACNELRVAGLLRGVRRGDRVGRSHECNYPQGLDEVRVLTFARIGAQATSKAIDAAVRDVLKDAGHAHRHAMYGSALGGKPGFVVDDERDGREIDRSGSGRACFHILIGHFRIVDDGSDTLLSRSDVM